MIWTPDGTLPPISFFEITTEAEGEDLERNPGPKWGGVGVLDQIFLAQ